MSAFWLPYITDHGNFGVAHALYHATRIYSQRVQNNHSYEFFYPYLPTHYATFMRLPASPLLSDF